MSAPASAGGLEHLGDAGAEAARWVIAGWKASWRVQKPSRRRVEQRDVGEGAARIDADDARDRWLAVARHQASAVVVAVTVEELCRGRAAPRAWRWPPHRRCVPSASSTTP